ncbi:MAG: hypothetical protein HZC02_00570 [Candidatus Levybacteria bacterium]|nr:hypothetical protein [Candidatus Levybacteria bacterium]
MTNLKTKITTGLVTAGIIANFVAPAAFADTDVTVKENGDSSTNKVKVKNKHVVKVKQKNTTNITNSVGLTQSTGGNNAKKNTGGDVTLTSGDATANVTIDNTTDGNTATVDGCGCAGGDTTVNVEGNGADSTNKVKVSNVNVTKATQKNTTTVINGVSIGQTTGGNSANSNTGGSVDVTSGDADATVGIANSVGENSLTIN